MNWSPALAAVLSLAGVATAGLAGCSSSAGSASRSPEAGQGDAAPSPGPTLVMTDRGPVQGVALDTARKWVGIPFAAPPVGALRWKPPSDVTPWTATRDATHTSSGCLTIASDGTASPGTSEDCLTINVWAPLGATSKAPVLAWIYGGGFTSGNAQDATYDGSVLASKEGVIVVTMNYRLGPLGFLSSKALAAEEGVTTSPSFGTLDQQAALHWVARNIAAFGGDPSRVMLFGESAGAFAVCAQVAMPGSHGLFSRALMESGACEGPLFFTAAAAQTQGGQLSTALGCTDPAKELSCLRALDGAKVLGALPLRKAEIGATGVSWGPVVDGKALPALPIDAMRAGTFNEVPMVIGSNHDEGNLFTYLYGPLTLADAQASLTGIFGSTNATTILDHYTGSAYPTPKDTVSAVITDGMLVCPNRRAARAIAATGTTVFLYQFTHAYNPGIAPGLGAAHSFELPFVWGNKYLGAMPPDADQPLIDEMQGYWTRFAAAADPNGGGAPTWPAFTKANDTNLVLDLPTKTETGLDSANCDFWDGLP